MSNQDFEFGQVPIDFTARRAQALVATSSEDNPDDAARANQIARAAGVSPGAAYENREVLEPQLKARLAGDIVRNNSFLQDYVTSHPLAAKVSNDDYGQLDEVSKKVQALGQKGFLENTAGVLKGVWHGLAAGPEQYRDIAANSKDFMLKLGYSEGEAERESKIIAGRAYRNEEIQNVLFAIPTVMLSPAIGAFQTYISQPLERSTGFPANVTEGLTMAGLAALGLKPGVEGAAKLTQTAAKVEPYIKEGKAPPVGIDPVIDQLHVEQAKLDADALGEALKEATKSATRERDPDMFKGFLEQERLLGQSQIGISADAVRKLYGDKLPEPDDGVLGFVPNLAEQLVRAGATGGDVQVSLADFTAKVEPEVYKELKDFIRSRPGGVTVEEGKVAPKADAYHGSPYEFDAFSDEKIGSGEGAQAFAYGHYLAESPVVAKGYQDKLSGSAAAHIADREQLIKDLMKSGGTEAGGKIIQQVQGEIEALKTRTDSGALYGVRVKQPKENFLPWEEDLTANPVGQMVLEKMDPSLKEVLEEELDAHGQPALEDLTGGMLHRLLERYASEAELPGTSEAAFDHPKRAASEYLSSLGVPGITFLDKKSRATGAYGDLDAKPQGEQPTRNFVVFNAKDMEIVSKNGEVVRAIRQAAGLTEPGPVAEPKPAPPELEGEAKAAFDKAAAIGMTTDQYRRWQKAIDKRAEQDRAAAESRAMAEQRRKQEPEWRVNRAELRKDVAGEFAKRPEFVADEMLRSQGTKLDASKLTPEQKAALPEKYLASMRRPGRVDPDDLARTLGVNSGTELVDKLAAMNADRGEMRPGEYVKKAIDAETDRRMESQYGLLDKSILEEAKDQVLSETQEEILHEEVLARASEAGLEFSLTKEGLRSAVKTFFDKGLVREIDTDRFLADAGRAGRATEEALLKGDFAEGFRQKQRQYLAIVMGRMAKEFEKDQRDFGKVAKRYLEREVSGTPQEYTNAVHDILQKLGLPIKRMPEDLAREMQAGGYANLADFVTKKEAEHSVEGLEFDVPDFLLQGGFKKSPEDLTVGEFRAMQAGVDNLIHIGRQEQVAIVDGAKRDLRDVIRTMHETLKEKWPAVTISAKRERAAKQLLNSAIAASTNLETLFQRFDGRDPRGLFTKTFVYPGAEAANYKARLEREFGAEYKALGKIKDAKKVLDTPLLDPETGEPVRNFTRENLAAVISNMGNAYNWKVFTKGWKIEPAVLADWVMKNSTREDFDRAFALSKIFDKGKRMADTVYRNTKGVAPEDIPLTPLEAHGKQYPGWYHPIIRDDRLSSLRLDADPLEKPTNFWPSTPNGYVKKRSGAVDVLALDYNMVPAKLNQILHDVAFREFITNSAKITRDKEFRASVSRHYGPEYVEEINQWIERVAGNGSYNSEAMSRAVRASNFFRQNVITTHIAFNLGTIEKHAATAAVMSAKELGPNTLKGALRLGKLTAEVAMDSLYHATMDLFGKSQTLGDSLSKFIDNTSEEIQRRERHYQDTVTDVHDALSDKSSIRQKVAYWGAKGVAISDKLSAKPLWLGKYREVMEDTGDHGQAVAQANFSVRRAHGSTAITALPRIAAGGGVLEPWMTSLYGFMGANMQRRIEIAHDMSDAFKLAKGGELRSALGKVPGIADSIAANVVWVGAIEEAVSGQFTEDKKSFGMHALGFVSTTLAQTIIGIRDLSYGLTHGREPQVGLTSGFFQEIANVFHDLQKPHPLSKQNAGKFVEDTITTFGDLTGVGPKPIARAVRYGLDVENNQQRPKTGGDIFRGVISGQQRLRKER